MHYALITGASSGLGLEFARLLAAQKINLVLVARSAGKLEQLAAELRARHGIDVRVLARDLGQSTAPREIFDALRELHIEYLINNAGFGEFGFFVETDWTKEEQMIDLNVQALVHLTKLFLPAMAQRRSGRIMNVSSTAAFQPGPTMAVYYATKAFVQSFSEALANEVADQGVTVTAFCPGATATGFQDAANLHESKLVKGRRLPTAAEVAAEGVRAMLKGKLYHVPGLQNYIGTLLPRFVSRALALKLVRAVQERA